MGVSERTFRTDGAEAADVIRVAAVNDLRCRLKKITTTDEGKIAIAIELEAQDPDTLEQIRDLIRVQQGEVELSITGMQLQGELDL